MGDRAKDKNFMRVVRASRNAPLIQLMEDAQDPKKLQKVKKDFAKALKASRKRVANSATELSLEMSSSSKAITVDQELATVGGQESEALSAPKPVPLAKTGNKTGNKRKSSCWFRFCCPPCAVFCDKGCACPDLCYAGVFCGLYTVFCYFYDESKNKDATKDESLSDEIDEEKWKEFMNLKRFQRLVYYRGRLLSNGCSYHGKGMDAGRIKIMWYPGVECEKPHMTGK